MSNKLMTSLTRPIEKNFLVCPVFAGIDYRGGGDNVGEGGNDVGEVGNDVGEVGNDVGEGADDDDVVVWLAKLR